MVGRPDAFSQGSPPLLTFREAFSLVAVRMVRIRASPRDEPRSPSLGQLGLRKAPFALSVVMSSSKPSLNSTVSRREDTPSSFCLADVGTID